MQETDLLERPSGIEFEPTGRGPVSGKTFFIFFGYGSASEHDCSMRDREIEHLGDDVAALRAAGARVFVELHGTHEALDAALCSRHPANRGSDTIGVLWSGHGAEDGSLSCHDDSEVAPENLSSEVAELGHVRLYVMSACWVGEHTSRWQKALGPQALVLGWGRPVTLQRAMEFMTPDENSSKDLDDLLLKHLGVRRVEDDGPLTALQELAALHRADQAESSGDESEDSEGEGEDETDEGDEEESDAYEMEDFEPFMDKVAEELGTTGSLEDDCYTLQVDVTPEEEGAESDRTHVVSVRTCTFPEDTVRLSATVGTYTDALDLPAALRALAETQLGRLEMMRMDDGTDFMSVEAKLYRRGLTPEDFAWVVQMVADAADKMEDIFFGSDDL